MTHRNMDDLDALKAALRQVPSPDPVAKADTIALAMKNFDQLQGTPVDARPNQDRPSRAGFLNGVRHMLTYLTSRPILSATTSAAAICVGLIVVLPWTRTPLLAPPKLPATEAASPAQPAAQPAAQPRMIEAEAPASSNVKFATDAEQADSSQADVAAADMASEVVTPPAPEAGLSDGITAQRAQAPKIVATKGFTLGEVTPSAEAQIVLENTEEFASAAENPIQITAENPVSTFSIDVDTASYSVIRQSLNAGVLPPPDAVRIEEMVNYFPYTYAAPRAGDAPFKSTVFVMQTPWNPGTRLVHIGLQGQLPALENRPPLNLVFLIDTSGSMDEPNKLPLLKQSLRLMLAELRPDDEVAMVAYAGSAGEVLPPTKASDSARILAALDNLAAGGSTAGAEGLALAYQVAKTMGDKDQVSRVLLATDGDFNVGINDPEGLTAYIAKQRESGIYLSVLGFGRGNLDDATMQALAQNGNGQAAYIDTLNEARKVLVDQLTGELFPIADDVKIQVEWNPATVAEYRLIGYETRALQREDFNNDRVDAGEIGAGHTVTAIYEVTSPDSPALRSDPLRYGSAPPSGGSDELGFLRLRYKQPGGQVSELIETAILPEAAAPTDDARFAVAMAGFGQLLTGASYLGDWGWDQAIDLAAQSRGEDPYGYRIEAVNMMRMAQSLSGN